MINVSNKEVPAKGWSIITVFLISVLAAVAFIGIPTSTTTVEVMNTRIPTVNINNPAASITNPTPNTPAATPTQTVLQSILDTALYDWVTTGTLSKDVTHDVFGNTRIIMLVYKPNVQVINKYMNVASHFNYGDYYLILGSVSNTQNLQTLALYGGQLVNIESSHKTQTDQTSNILDKYGPNPTPNQFAADSELFVNQGLASQYNGSGTTIAIFDDPVDFGSSDLAPAYALDSNGLPTSLDTAGWSLVATPLAAGTDVALSSDNSTLMFSEGFNSSLLSTLDEFGIADYNFWHDNYYLWAPKDWKIDPNWVDQNATQAPPKFGVFWQNIPLTDGISGGDNGLSWQYGYALIIDKNGDGKYDSAIIDMNTSAFVTYEFYTGNYGGEALPQVPFSPDYDFTNDKVVTWLPNSANKPQDFVFAADWNHDGANDWSWGAMANAYNRFGYLSVNQSLYGKVIAGVDPDGAGFSLYHAGTDFGSPHGEHGTIASSMAVSRGIVDYYVYNNQPGSWDYPYGNSTTYNLTGSAPGASLLSTSNADTWDYFFGWFWAAGFNLNSTVPDSLTDLQGSSWTWSGQLRANLTTNSWGFVNNLNQGHEIEDWLVDLMSSPNLGGGQTYNRDPWSLLTWNGTAYIDTPTKGNEYQPFNAAPFNGSTLYIGLNKPFSGVDVTVDNGSAVYTGTTDYYYWNGAAWTDLSPSTPVDWSSETSQTTTWTVPSNWAIYNWTSKVDELYWVAVNLTQVFGFTQVNVSSILPVVDNAFYGYPGMLMVFSAGNDGPGMSTGNGLGTLSLKVGATRSSHLYSNVYGSLFQDGLIADFSSAGPKAIGAPAVDVVAPGEFIYSAAPLFVRGDSPYIMGDGNYSYLNWSGTSAAAPAAAGVAAQVMQAWAGAHPSTPVNPQEIKRILEVSAYDLGFPGDLQGAGNLNASAAVDLVMNGGFTAGSNVTYENTFWSNARQRRYFGDPYNFYTDSVYSSSASVDNIDFPYSYGSTVLLNQDHSSYDLFTGNVYQGDTFNGNVTFSGNTSTLTPQAMAFGTPTTSTVSYTNTSGAAELINVTEIYATHNTSRLAIHINDNFSISAGSYYEMYVEFSGSKLRYADLFIWIDNGNGVIDWGHGAGNNDIGQISRAFPPYSVMRFNGDKYAGQELVLAVRGTTGAASDFYGATIKVTLREFTKAAWNGVTVTNPASGIFTVTADTTGWAPGFNSGWLDFGNGHSMAMSFKVNYKSVDTVVNVGGSPGTNNLGNFIVDSAGTYDASGTNLYNGGDLVWVPFSINDTDIMAKTAGAGQFVIKATQTNGGANDDFGVALYYDNPNVYRSGQSIDILASSTGFDSAGHPVVWYYINWFEDLNPGDYLSTRTPHNLYDPYMIGLFSGGNSAPFANISLELYFLNGTVNLNSFWTDSNGDPVASGSIIRGDFHLATTCNPCDPNGLASNNYVFFGSQSQFEVDQSGTYENGVLGDTSVDWWVTVDLQKGDSVSYTGGADDGIDDSDIYWFAPSGVAADGIPTTVPGPLPPDYFTAVGTSAAVEVGSFVAPETGTYYVAMDNWAGGSSGWFLDVTVARGVLKDYGASTVTINSLTDLDPAKVEATWDWHYDDLLGLVTAGFDKAAGFSLGVYTPTNLDTNLTAASPYFDNYRVPEVAFNNATETLLGAFPENASQFSINTFLRPSSSTQMNIGWESTDYNSATVSYTLIAWAGFTPWQQGLDDSYLYQGPLTSYKWNYGSELSFPDNFYTLELRGTDNVPYAGNATPAQLALIVKTVSTLSTVTITSSGPTTTVTTTTTQSAPGFQGIFMILSLAFVGTFLIRRRRR
ncbi:MAG: S8 family serine peptidase [Candidatus Thorarchaeota archaeon]